MLVLAQRMIAFAMVSAAVAWLIWSAADSRDAALREFHIFVPVTLLIGITGLWRGLASCRRHGMTEEAEGIVTLSLLALAWGHDASRAAIRRAAEIYGHDATWLEVADYRLFSGALLIGTALLVLRWATRHDFAAGWRWPQYLSREVAGELPWVAFAIIWIAFIAYQQHAMTRILAWLYLLIR